MKHRSSRPFATTDLCVGLLSCKMPGGGIDHSIIDHSIRTRRSHAWFIAREVSYLGSEVSTTDRPWPLAREIGYLFSYEDMDAAPCQTAYVAMSFF
jgi:hypothetical protein